jgi:hypothetical protein
MSRDGSVVRTYDELADPVWLDSQRFIGYRLNWQQDDSGEWFAATGPDGERLGSPLLGSVGAEVLTEMDIPLGPAVANGYGALAVVRFDDAELPETAIWFDGALSEWRSGGPMGWSRFGEQLALVHPRRSGPASEGWLEVVSWPELTTLWSDESLTVSTALFDPPGSSLAYPEYVERPRQPRQVPEFDLNVRLVDLATGQVGGFTAAENGDFAWIDVTLLEGQEIIVVGFDSLQAMVYDRVGQSIPLTGEPIAGPTVIGSADGSTMLFYDAELEESPLQFLRGEQLALLETPGLLTGPAPALAPDGSGVIVIARQATSNPQGSPATVLLHSL